MPTAPWRARARLLSRLLPAAALATATGLVAAGPAAPAVADTAPADGTPATVSADALPTVQINGVVWSQVTVGDTVYATGSFSSARPAGSALGQNETPRGNLIAYSISTGTMVASFNHSLNGQGLVAAKSPDGSRVYIGGEFTTVDGVARNRIAAFDTATGALVTSFAPQVDGRVRAITATNSTVYLGGNFLSVGASPRTRLAAVTTAGALTAWAPSADDNQVRAMVLTPDGSKVVVGGHFSKLNGVAARGLGAVSTATGATVPFAANQTITDDGNDAGITSLRTDGTYIFGSGYSFDRIGNRFEGPFKADPTTGKLIWLNDCLGDTYDVFPMGKVLYHVGHSHDCSVIGSFPDTNPRVWRHAMAVTAYPTTINQHPDAYGWTYTWKPASTVLPWNPQLSLGSATGQFQAAWSVTGNANYIALGGEFPRVNGVGQQGLVRFAVRAIAPNDRGPTAADTLTPTATSPAAGQAALSWTATWDQDNTALTYTVLRDGAAVYTTTVKSRFWILPVVKYTDTVGAGSHAYQIRVADPLGNTLTSGAATVTVG